QSLCERSAGSPNRRDRSLCCPRGCLTEAGCLFHDQAPLASVLNQVLVVAIIEVDDEREVRNGVLLAAETAADALTDRNLGLATAGEHQETDAGNVDTDIENGRADHIVELAGAQLVEDFLALGLVALAEDV